ncbi:MAG: hydantoinase/oxoprolinase family protein, partial [Proteobacteria bacterium]|nr:hydantoinase/oxoprolinase family protein [Pseudomonadota bacterium]
MSKSQGRGARLAVDIGGTFTDVALETGERRITIKVLTTQDAPDRGVLQGITSVLEEAHVAPEAVGLIIHGTTLATNALIERKGARTAFVTTDGFRDVLETGYERRFEQYDIYMDKPPPLVPRRLRFTVPERVAADGCVLRKLDEGALSTLAKQLESEGIESIGIGFLHSYVNAAHEERAREVLLAALPHLSVTISSEVSPEIREYDRFSTACANAYVQPQMAGYLSKLSVACRGMGLTCPLLLMTSAGGLTTIDSAIRFPIRLVESGPAGGAMLASHLARV